MIIKRRLMTVLALASLFMLTGLFNGKTLHAVNTSKIEESVSVYTTNKSAAVAMLTDIYEQNEGAFFHIRNILFGNQHYRIYMDFLREIPVTEQSSAELFKLDLLTAKEEYLIPDLDNYLRFHEDTDALLKNYAEYVVDDELSLLFQPHITNGGVFDLMMESHLREEAFLKFDSILSNESLVGAISNHLVSDYLFRSWGKKQRPLQSLIELYGLSEQTNMRLIRLASYYMDEEYEDVLAYYEANPQWYQPADAFELSVDLNYLLMSSYFHNGDYEKAEYYLGQVGNPWDYDLSKCYTLIYIGMEEWGLAENYLSDMKKQDDRLFFAAYLDIMRGLEEETAIEAFDNLTETNELLIQFSGLIALESYLLETGLPHNYRQEALLLTYSYYRLPMTFPETARAIRQSLLAQDTEAIDDFALSAAYSADTEAESDDDRVSDYLKYLRAAKLIENDEAEEAGELLREIIQADESSTVIRSLAVYLLREIS